MPMFYFDLYEHDREIGRDDEGTELSSVDRAREEAAMALAELAKDALRGVDITRTLSIKIRDESGTHLLETVLHLESRTIGG